MTTVNDTMTGLESWLAGFGLTGAAADEDSDGDSILNSVEYVIGGNPANQPDTARLPTVGMIRANLDGAPGDEDYLLFTYRCSDLAAVDPDLLIAVDWDADLTGPWATADGSHGEVTVIEDVPGESYDLIKVHIPRPLAVNGRLFARLRVEVAAPAPVR